MVGTGNIMENAILTLNWGRIGVPASGCEQHLQSFIWGIKVCMVCAAQCMAFFFVWREACRSRRSSCYGPTTLLVFTKSVLSIAWHGEVCVQEGRVDLSLHSWALTSKWCIFCTCHISTRFRMYRVGHYNISCTCVYNSIQASTWIHCHIVCVRVCVLQLSHV